MKRKLGIVSSCCARSGKMNQIDALKVLKDTGFDCFHTGSFDMATVCALKNEAEKVGIEFEFIHAPYTLNGIHVNKYWEAGIDYRPLFNGVMQSIDSAAEAGVKKIVHHVSGSWTAPQMSDFGIARFDRTVEYAVKKGVGVAFENLQHLGNITCLMERYHNVPEVTFCYDNGHAHCYTVHIPWLDVLGKRLSTTHLHDNWGLDKEDPKKDADYHLLPFEGDFDFKDMVEKMDKYNYQGSLMLEVWQKGKWSEVSCEEFLQSCYKRVKKIRDMSEA